MKKILLPSIIAVLGSATANAGTFAIDPAHSSIEFRVHHIVGYVKGHFDKFQGTFNYDPSNPAGGKATATIDASSINTGIGMRDNDLKSPKYFDAAKCPTLQFTSDKVMDVKDNTLKLSGLLTIHCVTKPVTMDVEWEGVGKGPDGKDRAGASAKTTVNRKDFNMTSGGSMVGDKIEISIDIEGIAQ